MAEIAVNTPFIIQVFDREYEGFDQGKFVRLLTDYKEKTPGVQRSNAGGYQSPPTLSEIVELQEFFQFIAESAEPVLQAYDIQKPKILINAAWVNFNQGKGQHNQTHIHDGILSGVFFVQTPQGSGNLNIMNPAMNCLWQGHNMANSRNHHTAEVAYIQPKAGKLYLWPSYLPHSVDSNSDDVERISISFNITAGD